MSYYALPKIYSPISADNIRIGFSDHTEGSFINKSLSQYLNLVKQQISYYISEWDDVKKLTNPYEYIHTSMPHNKYAISKIKPMIEFLAKIRHIT